MLTVETKFQSGGKLLPQSDLREGVFLEEALRRIRRDIKLGAWNVRGLYDLQEVGCNVKTQICVSCPKCVNTFLHPSPIDIN